MNVYDLVMKRYEQMKQGRETFDAFAGPVNGQQGRGAHPRRRTLATKDGAARHGHRLVSSTTSSATFPRS